MKARLGLRGEPRACRHCGIWYTPPAAVRPAAILVTCRSCNGEGCAECPPKGPPHLREGCAPPSGRGCGKVHAPECECYRCVDYPTVYPKDVQTCGADDCVAAWRMDLGRTERVKPVDPSVLRLRRLSGMGVPKEFRHPFELDRMAGGRGCEIFIRLRVDGKLRRRLDPDLVAAIMDRSEHPFAYIWGPLQSGKTRYAVDVMDRGVESQTFSDGLWVTTMQLVTEVSADRLGSRFHLEDRCKAAKILTIDDFMLTGGDSRSAAGLACAQRILQERWDNSLPTLITCSWPPSPIEGHDLAISNTPGLEWLYERLQQAMQVEIRPNGVAT